MALSSRGFSRGEGAATAHQLTPPNPWSPTTEPAPAQPRAVTTWESLTVASWRPESIPHRFEAWSTNYSLGTCPICANLDGAIWEEGTGDTPPAHPNCRCSRIYHHTEYEIRWHLEYRTTWEQIISIQWF